MLKHRNPNKQGDAGLGIAIGWFASQGVTVCVPLTDSQEYDLVVEWPEDPGLKKVQVKTTTYRHRRYGNYAVQLAVKGGNKSGTGRVKKFDNTKVDFLFVLTADDDRYLIPATATSAKTSLALTSGYDQYKV